MKLFSPDLLNAFDRERKFTTIFLAAVALLTAFDVFEDSLEGVSLSHIIIEVSIIASAVSGIFFLWTQARSKHYQQTTQLKTELEAVHKDNENWKNQNANLFKGFETAVEQQLHQWGLSAAESDVAFLILKGLSLKEIANLRESSERTVRQQAAAIYKKSNLEGRAQLAAFFLEDLFDAPRNTAIKNS